MARPLRPKNANNALRQLRGLLQDPVKGSRINQRDLAQLCQVSVDTIKSIETGRLALSSRFLENIAETITAHWDHEQGRWTRRDGKPFTFADYCEHYRRMLNPSPIDRAIAQGRVELIKSRIDWLFENVPDESWQRLLARLNHFLEECKRDLTSNSNDELYYHPAWLQSANESAGTQPLKAEQQKRRRAPKGAAGNKKRKQKYGL
jgi:transcriptional regulator with XRE-family HTH domain